MAGEVTTRPGSRFGSVDDGVLNAVHQATVAEVTATSSATGGVPIIYKVAAAALTGDITVTIPHKIEVLDVWCVAGAAGGAGDTITVKNGSTAITNAIDLNIADKTRAAAGTIDDAQVQVAAGANLVVTGASGVTADVYILAMRVA